MWWGLIFLIIIIENLNIISFKQKYIFDILGKNVSVGFVFLQMFVSVKVDLAERTALNVRTIFSFFFHWEILLFLIWHSELPILSHLRYFMCILGWDWHFISYFNLFKILLLLSLPSWSFGPFLLTPMSMLQRSYMRPCLWWMYMFPRLDRWTMWHAVLWPALWSEL